MTATSVLGHYRPIAERIVAADPDVTNVPYAVEIAIHAATVMERRTGMLVWPESVRAVMANAVRATHE